MKALILLALTFWSLASFAIHIPGEKLNVVAECESEDGSARVRIMSEAYTTRGDGKLRGDPGQIYLETEGKLEPLEHTEKNGWFDKTIGVYENENFLLNLLSRNQNKIFLRNIHNGQKLQCRVLGDCC